MAMRLHNYLGTKKAYAKAENEYRSNQMLTSWRSNNNKPNECSSLLLLFASSPPLKLLRVVLTNDKKMQRRIEDEREGGSSTYSTDRTLKDTNIPASTSCHTNNA